MRNTIFFSSRSHAICRVEIYHQLSGEAIGKFSLIDLAGSERAAGKTFNFTIDNVPLILLIPLLTLLRNNENYYQKYYQIIIKLLSKLL